MKTVIFACVHNAGRSQMSAAFFNAQADPAKARAWSAGTAPGQRVHPEVVEAMREVGIDLSGARPQKLTEELARQAQLLVTMGCGDECPYVPGLKVLDWPLPDPKGQSVEAVREIRDAIRSRVEALLQKEGWAQEPKQEVRADPKSSRESKPSGEQDPLAVDRRFFSALIAADVKSLDRLLADDFILIDVMRGAEVTKEAFLAVLGTGQIRFEAIEPAENRVRRYQTTAIVTGRTRMNGRFGDTPWAASSRYTHVYVQQQGPWRMVSAQGTPIAPEPDGPAA
jgi:arsenate reductase (thioredoxin)